jgi:T5SS/PEP-CTERM-associated repeat protein
LHVTASAECVPPVFGGESDEVQFNPTFEQLIAGLDESVLARCGASLGEAGQNFILDFPGTNQWRGQGSAWASGKGAVEPSFPGKGHGTSEFHLYFDVVGSPMQIGINGNLNASALGEATGSASYELRMILPTPQEIIRAEISFTPDANGEHQESSGGSFTLQPGSYAVLIDVASDASIGGQAGLCYCDFLIQITPLDEPPAECETMNWTGAADSGGLSKLFAEDENWTDDQPPDENQIARFTFASLADGDPTFDIAFPGPGNTTNAAIVVRAVQPDIDLATGSYMLTGDCPEFDSIEVGVDGGLLSDLLFKNGTVLAEGITVGRMAGEIGFLNAVSQGAISADGLVTIGDHGEGNLLVQIGGAFEAFEMTLGQDTTGVGHAFVTDPGSDMTIDPGGTLTVGFRGNADLFVGNQAKLDVFGDLLVGEQPGSLGFAKINSGAVATVEGLAIFGKDGAGLAEISGNGSTLTCGGATSLAVGAGALAVVDVKNGGALTTQDDFNIGYGGDGTLNINGAGAIVQSLDATLGTTATGKGAVAITNGGAWLVLDSVQVGAAGPGVISVDAGSTLQAQLLGVTSVGTLNATIIHIGAGTNAKSILTAQFNGLPGPGVFVEALIVEPGAKLNVGAIALDERGVLEIEIGGPTAGVDYQAMAITGGARLSGTLRVKLVGDYVPAYGQRFDVMTYAALQGVFSTIESPEGYAFAAEYGPNALTLIVPGGEPIADLPDFCGTCGAGVSALLPLALTGLVRFRSGPRRHLRFNCWLDRIQQQLPIDLPPRN